MGASIYYRCRDENICYPFFYLAGARLYTSPPLRQTGKPTAQTVSQYGGVLINKNSTAAAVRLCVRIYYGHLSLLIIDIMTSLPEVSMKLSEHESHKRHIFNNFMHYFSATCGVNEHNGCRYSIPEADFVLFNSVFDTDIPEKETSNIIKRMQGLYQHKKQFCWWLTDFVKPQSIVEPLQQAGFEKGSPFTGMIFDLTKDLEIPSAVAKINVQTVNNEEQLTEWIKPLQQSFGIDDHSSAFCANALKTLIP